MKVVIFEPVHTGHHFEYLARIVSAVQQFDVQMTVVCARTGIESEQFRIHLADLAHLFSIYECKDVARSSITAKMVASAAELVAAMRAIRPDHLYVPSADGLSQVLAMRNRLGDAHVFRNVFMEGLHFRGAYGYRLNPRRRLKSHLDGCLVTRAPWSAYYHVDPWQLDELCRRHPGFAGRASVMPDPVNTPLQITKHEARSELGIPIHATYLGCAGPISHRKGADLLLRAFAAAVPKLPSTSKLLLAGKFDRTIRELLEVDYSHFVSDDRIVVIDRHLSVREMDIVVPAMDIVTTPYRDHLGSSGILLRAAACKRPILATNRHWMNNVVTTFGLGSTCNVRDHDTFVSAIVGVFENSKEFYQPKLAERFVQFQSESNFLATWTSKLRKRLGLEPDPSQLAWDWVMAASRSN